MAQQVAFRESPLFENLAESPARPTQRLVECRFGEVHLTTNRVLVMIIEIKTFEHQSIPGLRQFAQQRSDCEGCLAIRRDTNDALPRIRIPVGCITVYICLLSLSLAQ